MYRTVTYFSLIVATFCFLGLVIPQSFSVLTYLLPNGVYAIINLVLAVILFHFGLAAFFRKNGFKRLFGILGTAFVLIGLIGIISPQFLGASLSFVRPTNMAILLLTGIGYLIAALEYQRPSLAQEMDLLRIRGVWAKTLASSKRLKRRSSTSAASNQQAS